MPFARQSVRGKNQQELLLSLDNQPLARPPSPWLARELKAFTGSGRSTKRLTTTFTGPAAEISQVATFVNEFWTAKQRQANALHEISYRACFKPQLPRLSLCPSERSSDHPGESAEFA